MDGYDYEQVKRWMKMEKMNRCCLWEIHEEKEKKDICSDFPVQPTF